MGHVKRVAENRIEEQDKQTTKIFKIINLNIL
jgi:hypothetical protein